MKVKDLKQALEKLPDDALVGFLASTDALTDYCDIEQVVEVFAPSIDRKLVLLCEEYLVDVR